MSLAPGARPVRGYVWPWITAASILLWLTWCQH